MTLLCSRNKCIILPVQLAASRILAGERAFSTSDRCSISLQLNRNDPEDVADVVPTYPYGPARWYKQSRLGLYGGQRIQFGNNVGEKIAVKTRRTWHPNVVRKNLFSKSLHRYVQLRVTTRTLRTIDKLGGLDEYLLGEKEGRIKALGESGWWLRWAIMQTPAIRKRFAAERQQLVGEAGVSESITQESGVEEDERGLEMATEAEVQEAVEQGDAVAEDGTFTVETSASLPRLKFRVGPGAHLVLTPKGWRRTRRNAASLGQELGRKLAVPGKIRYAQRLTKAIEAVRKTLAEEESTATRESTWTLEDLFAKLERAMNTALGAPAVLTEDTGSAEFFKSLKQVFKAIPENERITVQGLKELRVELESQTEKRRILQSVGAQIERGMLREATDRVEKVQKSKELRRTVKQRHALSDRPRNDEAALEEQ